MKNRINKNTWLIIPAMTLVFGLLFAGCENVNKPETTPNTPTLDTAKLDAKIAEATTEKNNTVVADSADEVEQGRKWVTQEAMTSFTYAITAAESALTRAATQAEINEAGMTLDGALTAFRNAQKTGTVIVYTVSQVGGTDGTATTTGIMFTFSSSIDRLGVSAADITIGGTAVKGSARFEKSGDDWLLSPITVNNAGEATVTITKNGITASIKDVIVYKTLPGTVSISGIAAVGRTLTANTDNLGGDETIFYQWNRDGNAIPNANSSTYTVQETDVGSTITVTVTRDGYSGSVSSDQTVTVVTIPALTGTVSISGTATVGKTLTANIDNLGGDGTIFYQWNRDGTAIPNANSSTYIVQAADVDRTITVTVTRDGYSGSVSSLATAVVTVSAEFAINLADEWELIEQTVQMTFNTYKNFYVTGTYTAYQWYLDGVPVGSSSSYTFNKPAEVYQLAVVVTDSAGESRSGRCRITVSAPQD